MDKSNADVVARAILEPDQKAQEELRRKKEAEARSLEEKRTVAWFSLAGSALGAAIAHFAGYRFAQGVIWGGLAAVIAGWAFVLWRRPRRAP